ncbi:penicillin-binding transpeptidase domain-containing protein [Tsukamurella sp. 8F]|uniref:penicillin-binding transpeptidase domain-containing protein n=1 Tax=unclassified Tsukamurella TaxID=2633480 RepID=UPI0023B92CC0|nr:MULTISPECIES: penicillin-binding transpeptidase domain-containing protein [unclassified Tsukamurella]MDF0531585.1 penicillin-binding transpeptidase domain-containing protein [Tsukamurella sp. 8J]MDF0587568.1 penicillin-binding transpeptidase domain-containing protein [Tsukamurella sp. 8F]
MRSSRVTVAAVLAAVLAVAATACGTDVSGGPGPAAARFGQALARALNDHDVSGAANLTDSPDAAAQGIRATFDGLQATGVEVKIGQVRTSGATSVVDYEYVWKLPKNRVWDYRGTFDMESNGGVWQVRWEPTALHPNLGANQTMVLRSLPATKASVNSSSGGSILVPGVITRITLDASKVQAPTTVLEVATQLAQALAPVTPGLDPVGITEQATSLGRPYVVTTVDQKDLQKLPGVVTELPGVAESEQSDMVPTDRTFAPALMSSIKQNVQGRLDGTDGWSVIAQADTGAQVGVLTETDPKPKPSVFVSISPIAQAAAQAAVNTRTDKQAMMVVIKPSTGDILAVAQNPQADKMGSLATSGLYPPGSTGKIVTGIAAMEQGVADPTTVVPCPATITIGQREVPNYNRFSLGDVSMQEAFAASCNTAFAFLGNKLPPDKLHQTSASLGIGLDYTIPGLDVAGGQYPVPKDPTTKVEDSFGQGQVLVSPFAMALAAATVAHGGPVVPQLIAGQPTKVGGARDTVPPTAFDGMRAMMRAVVQSGTALLIGGEGDVYGKTGEAEVDGGSHAWFVGYRGDLAFATLIPFGGSSDNAVAVTKTFFDRYDAPVPSAPAN